MKKTSIKFYVIWQLILSCVLAFILTFLTFIICFGSLQIVSEEKYTAFLNLCNSSNVLMSGILLITIGLFIVYFFIIFMRRMNNLTSYISEIVSYVDEIATGDLKVNIPIRQQNELGVLASQINQMTIALNDLIQKEQEWDKQKYNLITNLSHDLKTPLMSIMGFLELIYHKQYKDEKMLEHYSQVAYDKSIQLKKAIDSLFELSKLSNSDVVIQKVAINMKELAEQVLMGFIPELEKKQIQYEIQVKVKETTIQGDPLLMVRVLENLINNALKYGIGAQHLIILIEELNERIFIHVINDGEPIAPEDQDKIFNRFYRAEKKQDKKEGNGVGLAIVRTIVELHQGSVEVSSDSQKTDFKISLQK